MYTNRDRLLLLRAVGTLVAVLSLLFAFAAPPQPALAQSGDQPPTVNGLFYGDGDNGRYPPTPDSISTIGGARLYSAVYTDTLYVALVVDGRYNDNVFDPADAAYMSSAGWTQERDAVQLMNSEYAAFEAEICGVSYEWQQGYARPSDDSSPKWANNTDTIWVSNATLTNGGGSTPPLYDSSSSIVWNLNNWRIKNAAGNPTYNMNVNCPTIGLVNGSYESGCATANWKSPFDLAVGGGHTVVGLGGYPATTTTATPITYSDLFQWEWAMVYEWSADVSACTEEELALITVTSPDAHHSPFKEGATTAVSMASVNAKSGMQMPVLMLALALGATVATAGALSKTRKSS